MSEEEIKKMVNNAFKRLSKELEENPDNLINYSKLQKKYIQLLKDNVKLQQENQKYKEVINKIKNICNQVPYTWSICGIHVVHKIEKVLSEVENEKN